MMCCSGGCRTTNLTLSLGGNVAVSTNRVAWIGVVVVVVVVGGFVVRSLKTDNTIRTASTSQQQTSARGASAGDQTSNSGGGSSGGSEGATNTYTPHGSKPISSVEQAKNALK